MIEFTLHTDVGVLKAQTVLDGPDQLQLGHRRTS